MSLLRSVGSIGIAMALAGCAGPGPYRSAADDFTSKAFEDRCQSLYADTDASIATISTGFGASNDVRDDFLGKMHEKIDGTPKELKPCWETVYEHHSAAKYDLYYAEFDEAGQATDIASRRAVYRQSELYLIENSIRKALGEEKDVGLNIVVFTHGWHGGRSDRQPGRIPGTVEAD